MHVYRIEWPDGSGYYTGSKFDLEQLPGSQEDEATARHPLPPGDSQWMDNYHRIGWQRRADTRDLRWAFESLRSLRRWFYNDQWVRNIDAAGGLLCTYEVDADTTIVGRTQVAFDQTSAKLITKEPLINILEKV